MILLPRDPARWKPRPWPWARAALAEPFASIARACVFLVPMWEEGGSKRCVVTRTVLTLGANATHQAGAFGRSLNTSGLGVILSGPAGFRPLTTPNTGYSIFGVSNAAASGVAQGSGALLVITKTNPWIEYGLLFNHGVTGGPGYTGQATAYHYSGASSADTAAGQAATATALGTVDGRWNAYGSTYSPLPKTTLWVNGQAVASVTAAAPNIYDTAQTVQIGGWPALASRGTTGGIGLVSLFSRTLEDWEMRTLHDDPMGLVRQARVRTFFIPPGSVPPPAASVSATAQAPKPTIAAEANQAFPGSDFTIEFSSEFEGNAPPAELENQSLSFDNDTGHIRYPLTSAWAFPDADWTVGILSRIDDPSGGASQYFISAGGYGSLQSFNFFIYESGAGGAVSPGMIECNIRGSGSAIQIIGPADANFLNNDWRLWVVERVKATETMNIYVVPVNGTRTLYHSQSIAGLGAITPTVPAAIATRTPPLTGSQRWLAGSVHSVFKMNSLMTAGEMQSLASGSDLIADLGKTPELLTRLRYLTSPVPNSGSVSDASGSVVGGVAVVAGPQFISTPPAMSVSGALAAPKPTVASTATQTSIARSVSGAISANKPEIATTSTQTFPTRAVAGQAVAKKPTAAATAVQVFPARAVSGTIVAPKPGVEATAVQTFPARAVTGTAAAKKPAAAGTAVQVFPARAVAGTVAANKPTLSAAAVQIFPARAITGSAAAPRPTISATATQTSISRTLTAAAAAKKPASVAVAAQEFPERYVEADGSAPKPAAAVTATQVFPARSLDASVFATKPDAAAFTNSSRTVAVDAIAPKPAAAATALQLGIGSLSVTAAASATKPTIAAAAVQIFPARSLTGSTAASKPRASAAATQVYPARSLTAVAAARKPTAAGVVHQVFEDRYVEGQAEAQKPQAAAAVVQSTIGTVSVFGTASAPKPAATAVAIQIFPERFVAASALVPKPAASAVALTTRKVAAAAVSPKPAATATAGQTYPARNVGGSASAGKPMLTATATHPYPAHIVTAAATAPKPVASAAARQVRSVEAFAAAPKPTAAAAATQVFPPRFLSASATAPKPAVQAFVEQIFPARAVDAIVFVAKPTASAAVTLGPSPGAAHIAGTVYLTGVIDYEQRFAGSIDMDVVIAGASETDIALTGIIEN